jgi:hypothetical protein
MGVCRRQALRRLQEKQRNHPELEILIPRCSAAEKWWINATALRRAIELERQGHAQDLENRVGILESALRITRQKVDRLALRVYRKKNAE